ncbi:LysM and hypothetical peptidoglycan-binding domain-containing protein 2-like protein [Leptotrombidium deliense]|uniref:LysM and hypothetical peptidoglycan-binding domain-containing protein 2-like protein n=1 Tax=Leptotrombidium deliense TaxID=299467 RepID=A0A443SJB8_9ACAR|nr:LysM and hypothetical peptidoglycan-binding domain-containing protein 2-like protein [Leptotrombidium deliense]
MEESAFYESDETKSLTLLGKKPTKYGSTSKHQCNSEKMITHSVEETDTLPGLALRYGVSIEKIKRANNMWTSDSLFLRPVLNIPLPSDILVESTDNGYDSSSVSVTNRKENTVCVDLHDGACTSKYNGLNHRNSHSNVLTSSKLENGFENSEQDEKDESAADFLIRIDSHIAKGKDNFKSIMQQKSKMTNTYSDDDLYKMRGKQSNCYPTRNNSVSAASLTEYMNEVPKVMTHSRKVKSSLKRLEKKQDELFEL